MDLEIHELEMEETLWLLELERLNDEKQKIEEALITKKNNNGQSEQHLNIISLEVQRQMMTKKRLEQEVHMLRKDMVFLGRNVCIMDEFILKQQRETDQKIRSELVVGERFGGKKRKSMKESCLDDVLGLRCKFLVQNLGALTNMEIEVNGDQTKLKKAVQEMGYTKITSKYPMPSQGRFYFEFTVDFTSSQPTFLVGLTTTISYLYFRYPKPSFFFNEQILQKSQGYIDHRSSIRAIIDCSNSLLMITIDDILVGHLSFDNLQNQSLYFFIGLSEPQTTLTFQLPT